MRKNDKQKLIANLLETAYVEAVGHRHPQGRQCSYFRLTVYSSDNKQALYLFRDLVNAGCVIHGGDGGRWALMGKRAWCVYEEYRELLSPEKRELIESVATSCDPKPWEPSRAGRPRKVAA
jgi:hypothetical protein